MAAELKKPANLTVWAWTPGTEEAVKMFEKAYPNIKVKLAERGPGPAALPQGAHRPEVGQGPAGRHPHGVPVHPELHASPKDLLDMTPVPAGQLPVEVPRVDPEADQPRRRDLRRPVGHRPARLHLPQGPARQGRHQDADQDVGRVRRRGEQVPQGQPGLLPGQHAGRPDRAVARAVLAERRAPVHRRPGEPEDRPHRARRSQEVTEFWDKLYEDGRDLARRRLQRRLVPGLREGQVRRLALRGLGADLPPGLHEELQGQVARAAAAAVGGRATTCPATGAARRSRC